MNTLETDLAHHYDEYTNVVRGMWNWAGKNGIDFLINTLVALFVVFIGWLVVHYVHRLVAKVLTRKGLHTKLRVRMLVGLAVAAWWIGVVFVVFRCYNVNLVPALAGFGVAGIVVGFAFQESLSSLAAGAMMSFGNPFELGDEVTIAGYNGRVHWFGYTSTVIETWDHRLVTIPNKQVWGTQIVNHTRAKFRRVDRTISIAYEADLDKALKVVRKAIASVPGVLKDPAPQVWCTDLADSAVVITVWPWVESKDYWQVWETSYPVIKKALEENGIAIPYPQLDVHLPKARS